MNKKVKIFFGANEFEIVSPHDSLVEKLVSLRKAHASGVVDGDMDISVQFGNRTVVVPASNLDYEILERASLDGVAQWLVDEAFAARKFGNLPYFVLMIWTYILDAYEPDVNVYKPKTPAVLGGPFKARLHVSSLYALDPHSER